LKKLIYFSKIWSILNWCLSFRNVSFWEFTCSASSRTVFSTWNPELRRLIFMWILYVLNIQFFFSYIFRLCFLSFIFYFNLFWYVLFAVNQYLVILFFIFIYIFRLYCLYIFLCLYCLNILLWLFFCLRLQLVLLLIILIKLDFFTCLNSWKKLKSLFFLV
jgi:hypothetical protein